MGLLDDFAERWKARTDGDTGTEQRRALTAAGAKVNLTNPKLSHMRREQWASEAWAYRDKIPELRFAGEFVASALGRLKVYPAENRPRGEEPVPLERSTKRGTASGEVGVEQETIDAAVAAVERLNLNQHGASLLGRIAENLEFAGECYLLGERGDAHGDDVESWSVRSILECQITQGGGRIIDPDTQMQQRELNDTEHELMRLWTPHPAYYERPDSSVRSVLDTVEDMWAVAARGRARNKSRIGAGKVFFLPSEATMARPGGAPISADLPGSFEDGEQDPLMQAIIEYVTTPVVDQSDVSSIAPMILRLPAMLNDRPLKDLIGTIDLHSGVDPAELTAQYESLTMRLARGMNLAPERITGLGDSNNWQANVITADEVKNAIEPRAERICDSLTAAYLQRMLRAMGIRPEQRRKVCLWFDSSELVQNPNRAEDAKAAHTAGAMSDASLLRHLGFTADDAPDNLEMLRRAVDRERLSPASVPILVKVLTGNMPTQAELDALNPKPEPPRPIVDHGKVSPPGPPRKPPAIDGPPPVGQRTQPATASPPGALGASGAKRKGPKDDPQGPSVAGIALMDSETGRVLMLQRGIDDDRDPAAGTWEFPGGHVEDGDESSFDAGRREWAEEVGRPFPDGGHILHTWTSGEGIYQGHLVVLPGAEKLVDLDGERTVKNADDDYSEQSAWWDLETARASKKALRDEVVAGTPWKALRKASESLRSPVVVAAIAAAGRDQSGRFAGAESARQWRLDKATGRKLTAIDRALGDSLLALAEQHISRAREKAANRLRAEAAKTGRGGEARDPIAAAAFPKGCDPQAVVAAGGPWLRGLTTRAEIDQLVDSAIDDLKPRFHEEVDAAARATADVLDALTEKAVTAAGVRSRLVDGIKRRARDAWRWLSARLRDHARRLLYGDWSPNSTGESSGRLVPAALIRAAMAMAGGLPERSAGIRDDGTSAGEPLGGVASGEAVHEELRAAGALSIGFRWEYPALPRDHFPGHRDLDGIVFGSFDDPQLKTRTGDEWLGDFYHPLDHAGCRCWCSLAALAVPIAADADPNGDEVASLRRKVLGR